MSKPNPFLFALALALAGAGVAPVWAATADPLPVQLQHCAALTVASVRLACYDALAGLSSSNQVTPPAAAGSSAATGAGAGTAAPGASPAASSSPPAGPGAQAASAEMEFGVHNGPLEAKLITPQREKHLAAVVSAISSRPRGELIVTLDNGQVWAQLEATRYPLKTGDHVEIDVGAMGSYVLWCPSIRRATKVTRIS